jgi:high affinity Mn2+ porin
VTPRLSVRLPVRIAGSILALCACTAFAVEDEVKSDKIWDARLQATWVRQLKAPFDAAYSGVNSLSPARDTSYSFSTTAYLGLRPQPGLEFWFNPEVVRGVPFSGLHGLGGFPNGEQQKSGGPNFTLYRARLFLRKTWSLGGEQEEIDAAANQFGQSVGRRRLVVTAGNLAASDIFDANTYAHDPRTQFMNWSLMTHGAWDYAADARGYSWGMAGEWYHDQWVLRFGRFMQPVESNGLPLDTRIFKYYGDQLEVEHGHSLWGRAGKLRALAFHNRANMGSYRDALAVSGGVPPTLDAVRRPQSKVGAGLALEQEVADHLGLFARASYNDGRTESYAFTEIDRSFSAGLSAKGRWWGRPIDSAGLALVRNGLSAAHRDYLAAGGLGAFLGDGRLNYGSERIVELYYSLGLARDLWLTFDWQRIVNPGYNRDRGPVSIGSLRLHFEL